MDVEGAAGWPGGGGGVLEGFEASEEVGEGDAGFHACKGGAYAGVDAVAEGDVGIGLAGDVEAVGVWEYFFVAIGGADHGED